MCARLASRPAGLAATAGMGGSIVPRRNVMRKPVKPKKYWNRRDIELKVLDILFDHAKIPEEQITLEANIVNTLFIDYNDRYGLMVDVQVAFEFELGEREHMRDFKSGREIVDVVMAIMEETHRLQFD
ncbi:hypothetical protein HK101_000808 [Irineochytrium annulatum]|nr:hypothetical protein HK101_000808 [Irineochytrium annulatum]